MTQKLKKLKRNSIIMINVLLLINLISLIKEAKWAFKDNIAGIVKETDFDEKLILMKRYLKKVNNSLATLEILVKFLHEHLKEFQKKVS